MIYDIITPFSRKENVDLICNHLKQFNDIVWHPIIHEDILFPDETWIKPFKTIEAPSGWDKCYHKLNAFLNSPQELCGNRFCFFCDDDAYSNGFFDDLDKISIDHDVIMVSMLRGHNQNYNGDVPLLVACHENMKVARVGLEQPIFSNRLRSKIRFINYACADGVLCSQLPSLYNVFYAPEIYVKFNYFQPGRWYK